LQQQSKCRFGLKTELRANFELTTQYKGLRNQNTAVRMDVNNMILKEVEKFLFFLMEPNPDRKLMEGSIEHCSFLLNSVKL